MPYLIETYKQNRYFLPLILVDVDANHPYETMDQADEAVRLRIVEQNADNKALMDAYYEKLAANVLDLDDTFATAGSFGSVPLTKVFEIGIGGADLNGGGRRGLGRGTGSMRGERTNEQDKKWDS